ncbi:MAG TPA: universal stress protein, partial [Actinomycetota bacterium]|nr:universal stress protein [Actinomycetota bacterium]
ARAPERAYARILVGTDGSDTAMRAVDAAAALAADLDAALLVACAFDPPSERELDRLRADPGDVVGSWGASRDAARVPDEFRWRIAAAAQAEDVLERAADRAAAQGADPEARTLRGDPAEALLAEAEGSDYDLLVVGSVGMTGARRFALGNVPHRVSHHATVDVLVSRTA